MGAKKGKKKTKRYRPAAALLKWMQNTPLVVVALVVAKYLPMRFAEELDTIDREVYSGKGHPHNSLKGIFLAYVIERARGKHSENRIAQEITRNERAKKRLKLLESNGPEPMNLSPDKKIYARLRTELGKNGRLLKLHYLAVNITLDLGVMNGRILFMDSKAVDLCTQCKHAKTCPWLTKNIKKFPKGCAINTHENAKPMHKTDTERFVGYKKHDIKDWKTGHTIIPDVTAGNAADNVVGLELLKELKKQFPTVKVDYLLADASYDDTKIYTFCVNELRTVPIIRLRKDTTAEFFTIESPTGPYRISPDGTPWCKATHPMTFVDYIRDRDKEDEE